MVLIRALGWLLLAAAVAAIANDCLSWWSDGSFRLLSLGDLWARVGPASFHHTEVLIDQRISAGLWRGALKPLLGVPALPVLAGLGALLIWVGRRPARRRTAAARSATVGARPPRRRRSRSGIT